MFSHEMKANTTINNQRVYYSRNIHLSNLLIYLKRENSPVVSFRHNV